MEIYGILSAFQLPVFKWFFWWDVSIWTTHWQGGLSFFYIGHFNCMPGFIWIGFIYGRTKNQGTGCAEKCLEQTWIASLLYCPKDFVPPCIDRLCHHSSLILVSYESTAPVFAYRIESNGGCFALFGLISLFIALLTVSSQAIKASWANPIKSLGLNN